MNSTSVSSLPVVALAILLASACASLRPTTLVEGLPKPGPGHHARIALGWDVLGEIDEWIDISVPGLDEEALHGCRELVAYHKTRRAAPSSQVSVERECDVSLLPLMEPREGGTRPHTLVHFSVLTDEPFAWFLLVGAPSRRNARIEGAMVTHFTRFADRDECEAAAAELAEHDLLLATESATQTRGWLHEQLAVMNERAALACEEYGRLSRLCADLTAPDLEEACADDASEECEAAMEAAFEQARCVIEKGPAERECESMEHLAGKVQRRLQDPPDPKEAGGPAPFCRVE